MENKLTSEEKYYLDNYSYNVEYSNEDKCFVARVKEFDFLAAHGATKEEALQQLKSAIVGCFSIIKEQGKEPPEPIDFS